MQMTSEEICRHYVQAADRKKDITVLAELNETDEASIRAVLIDGGVLPPDPPKRGRRPRADKPAEPPLTASPKEPKLKGIVCPNAVGEPGQPGVVVEDLTIYERVDKILGALPDRASQEIRTRAYNLVMSMLADAIGERLGLRPEDGAAEDGR